jgi:hypothetical protein
MLKYQSLYHVVAGKSISLLQLVLTVAWRVGTFVRALRRSIRIENVEWGCFADCIYLHIDKNLPRRVRESEGHRL